MNFKLKINKIEVKKLYEDEENKHSKINLKREQSQTFRQIDIKTRVKRDKQKVDIEFWQQS